MAKRWIKIDEKILERLACLHCSTVEIASVFGCDEATIRKRYSEKLKKWREKGKAKLRRLQWKAAMSGNTAMLIFLGKNMLGQTDRIATEQSITETKREIKINFNISDGQDIEQQQIENQATDVTAEATVEN